MSIQRGFLKIFFGLKQQQNFIERRTYQFTQTVPLKGKVNMLPMETNLMRKELNWGGRTQEHLNFTEHRNGLMLSSNISQLIY